MLDIHLQDIISRHLIVDSVVLNGYVPHSPYLTMWMITLGLHLSVCQSYFVEDLCCWLQLGYIALFKAESKTNDIASKLIQALS
jgi:hypothetical protein